MFKQNIFATYSFLFNILTCPTSDIIMEYCKKFHKELVFYRVLEYNDKRVHFSFSLRYVDDIG